MAESGWHETHESYEASLILAANCVGRSRRSSAGQCATSRQRRFVCLVSKSAQSELGRVGALVVREYKQSAYPISTEVWEPSDAGVSAIGEFPVSRLPAPPTISVRRWNSAATAPIG